MASKTQKVKCEQGHYTTIAASSVEKDGPTIWQCNVIDDETGEMCGQTNTLEPK